MRSCPGSRPMRSGSFASSVFRPGARRCSRALDGRVVDARGFPIAAAVVRIDTPGAAAPVAQTTTSAQDGTFHATGLPAPPYRVHVEHAQYAPSDVHVGTPAPSELKIILRP